MRLSGVYEAQTWLKQIRSMGTMTAAKPQAELDVRRMSLARWLLLGAVVVGVIAGILFSIFPQIDLGISALFYRDGSFFGKINPGAEALRAAVLLINVLICAAAIAGLSIATILKGPWLGVSVAKWLFLAICLAVGPGLVCNYGLKNNRGRARPSQIAEFGGTKAYSPPLTPSDQCSRNCSFVAGEASTIYIAFFAGAFIFPNRARKLIAAGIAAVSAAGLLRMSQGAHFFSDVIFSGVIMAITAGVIQLLFMAIGGMDRTEANTDIKKTPA
jgi:lipid A 4'-phosphatase